MNTLKSGEKSRKIQQTTVLAAGCFWGVEKTFADTNGVDETEVGFSGGHHEKPTYKEVCTGRTGHVECVKIVFNPNKISFDELLDVFWKCHDPTSVNRQGLDMGSQYASKIFYTDEEQHQIAEKSKAKRNAEFRKTGKEIQTKIEKFITFYPADEEHQKHWKKNERKPG